MLVKHGREFCLVRKLTILISHIKITRRVIVTKKMERAQKIIKELSQTENEKKRPRHEAPSRFNYEKSSSDILRGWGKRERILWSKHR